MLKSLSVFLALQDTKRGGASSVPLLIFLFLFFKMNPVKSNVCSIAQERCVRSLPAGCLRAAGRSRALPSKQINYLASLLACNYSSCPIVYLPQPLSSARSLKERVSQSGSGGPQQYEQAPPLLLFVGREEQTPFLWRGRLAQHCLCEGAACIFIVLSHLLRWRLRLLHPPHQSPHLRALPLR